MDIYVSVKVKNSPPLETTVLVFSDYGRCCLPPAATTASEHRCNIRRHCRVTVKLHL